jgi:hypothetical protein
MKTRIIAIVLSLFAFPAIAGSVIGGNPGNPVMTTIDGRIGNPYMVGYRIEGDTLTITKHLGGLIVNFYGNSEADIMRKARRAGMKVVIDAPEGCYSACTVWLSYPGVKVTDRSMFYFHEPSYMWFDKRVPAGVGAYVIQLPRELRPWVRKNVHGFEFIPLTGAQIKAVVPRLGAAE